MSKDELTQLIRDVQKDIGQFDLLYSEIAGKVYYYCYAILGNKEDASDASQEAMIRIYNNLHKLRKTEHFSTWSYTIIRNCCYDQLEKAKGVRAEAVGEDELPEEHLIEKSKNFLPEEAFSAKEGKELLKKFIGNLPKRQKEVIVLYYLEEFKINEIADILDYNAGSVKSRLHSGRKSLERQIKDYEAENKIKLFAGMLMPLLSESLNEHMEEISKGQESHFKYKGGKLSSISRLISKLSRSATVIVGAVACVAIVTISATFALPSNDSTPSVDIGFIRPVNSTLIKKIEHIEFPKRTSVEVHIMLEKNILKKNINIAFKENSIDFRKKGKELYVEAKANGLYKVYVNDEEAFFEVDNIDKYAPEVTRVDNNGSYLELKINDERSQINYEKSYIEHEEKKYSIGKDGKVKGKFKGEASIILFNKKNQFIRYCVSIK